MSATTPEMLGLVLRHYPGVFQVDTDLLKKFPIRTFRSFLRKQNLTNQQFSDLCEEKFTDIYASLGAFNIFGCPDSRDVDLVVVINNSHKPVSRSSLQKLRDEVKSLVGKDDLDINYITLDNTGNILDLSKGSRETQNIVIETYHLHPQKYPLLFKEKVYVERIDKVRGLIKYVIDHVEVLTEIPTNTHLARTMFYMASMDERIDQITRMYITPSGHPQFLECIKSLTVKCIQLYIYPIGIYTKRGLAAAVPELESDLLDMLYRKAFHQDSFNILWQKVIKILDESKLRYKTFYEAKLDVTGAEVFSPVLVEEFAKSTERPTDVFVNEWLKKYGRVSDTINEFSVLDKHIGTLPDLPSDIAIRIMMANPRSPEWLVLLKTYKCGRNSGLVPTDGTPEDIIHDRYNLIRGIIVETAIMQKIEWSKIILNSVPFTIGMIVEDLTPGSRGCCPDLLLSTPDGVVVVEIKCILGNSNSNFERAYSLATKQIKTARDFFGRAAAPKGLFVLAKCVGSAITVEMSTV